MKMGNKIIVIDWGIISHRSIFSAVKNPGVPATYTALSSVIGNLKRIGVNKEDKVIIAIDARNSWRKDFEKDYKGDRKEKRKESPIDWDKEYENMNWLLDKINESTNFYNILLPRTEADDIMAVSGRFFKDNEVILVTYDSDLHQCWSYPNVKIFSPKTKRYKIMPKNYNAQKDILKKVNKEASDNLTNPLLCENDFNNRLKCVNLLELPKEIENQIIAELDNLSEKEEHLDQLPYPTLRARFPQIYGEGTESYKKSVKYYERKEKAKMKKKALKKGQDKKVKEDKDFVNNIIDELK
jgi:hypothetical protein